MNNISTPQDSRNNMYKAGISVASAIGMYEAEPYIRKFMRKPISKIIRKQFEQVQGGGYREYIEKAIEQNNLKDLKLIDLHEGNIDIVRAELGLKNKKLKGLAKAILHILRIPTSLEAGLKVTAKGQNAFFYPKKNVVVCNFDKFGAPIFHEISHKLNANSKNIFMKALRTLKPLGSIIGVPFILASSLFTKKKDKNAGNRTGFDFIKDNCGLLAFGAMLPKTLEECIANIKGTKIAKQAGLKGELLNKVIKCHWTSAFSYCSSAIIVALSVFIANKLKDFITEKSGELIDKNVNNK